MKKILLLTILCLAISGLSFGQLEVLSPDGTHALKNGDTVVCYGDASGEMNVYLSLVHNDPGNINVGARRDSILLPMVDTDNDFCWAGFCYSIYTNVSPNSETLSGYDTANTLFNDFQGHYFPYGHLGAAYIRYDFYNASNPSSGDSAWVVVEYVATPTGVQNISNHIHFATPYPNPANSFATISYGFTSGTQSANLKIFNMLGECIQTLPLSTLQNTTTLNVQNMPAGIYICEIQAQGCSPVYQKLVVSR